MKLYHCNARVILASVALVLLTIARAVPAQEFLPPEEQEERGKFWIGVDGFSTRLGFEFSGDRQGVLGGTIDLGYLGSERLRLRPFGEVGFGNENDSYVVGTDLILRLTSEREIAIPYFGLGFGVFGSESCGELPNCPEIWPILTLGFDVRVQSRINWLIEYRSEDSFGRHRIFVGLATRSGG